MIDQYSKYVALLDGTNFTVTECQELSEDLNDAFTAFVKNIADKRKDKTRQLTHPFYAIDEASLITLMLGLAVKTTLTQMAKALHAAGFIPDPDDMDTLSVMIGYIHAIKAETDYPVHFIKNMLKSALLLEGEKMPTFLRAPNLEMNNAGGDNERI
jgi:hypothetical protein